MWSWSLVAHNAVELASWLCGRPKWVWNRLFHPDQVRDGLEAANALEWAKAERFGIENDMLRVELYEKAKAAGLPASKLLRGAPRPASKRLRE